MSGTTDFTKLNLRDDVGDMAPRFGMPEGLEARFARKPLDANTDNKDAEMLPNWWTG